MSTPKFKKHPKWIGKDLSIHINGGDKKIADHAVLEGPQWARFVGMGFLVQLPDEPAKAQAAPQAPAPAKAPPAAPPAPPPSKEGTTTKSPAGKLSDAAVAGTDKPKGGKQQAGKGPKPAKEPASEPKTDLAPAPEKDAAPSDPTPPPGDPAPPEAPPATPDTPPSDPTPAS